MYDYQWAFSDTGKIYYKRFLLSLTSCLAQPSTPLSTELIQKNLSLTQLDFSLAYQRLEFLQRFFEMLINLFIILNWKLILLHIGC